MEYEFEELLPIVRRLTERYTGYESTSVTYETAQQLMQAVCYCLKEAETSGQDIEMMAERGGYGQGADTMAVRRTSGQDMEITAERRSAAQSYEIGAARVEAKVKHALALYNQILPEFDSYHNLCLHDTFVKGLPEFFKWYDAVFEPQNTILTLDYPVLEDLSEYVGIDRIYRYIACIRLEQRFLSSFPKDFVVNTLSAYSGIYQDMIENICEIVFASIVVHMLVKKPLTELEFNKNDDICIRKMLQQADRQQITAQIKKTAEIYARDYCSDMPGLSGYLAEAAEPIAVRLKVKYAEI